LVTAVQPLAAKRSGALRRKRQNPPPILSLGKGKTLSIAVVDLYGIVQKTALFLPRPLRAPTLLLIVTSDEYMATKQTGRGALLPNFCLALICCPHGNK
jgi:hypothetical protein